MRHFVTMMLMGLLLCICPPACFCQTAVPEKKATAEEPARFEPIFDWADTTFDLSAGYRRDSLSWSIAGNNNGHYVNILSELQWSDLTIYQLSLSNRTVIRDRVYLRGHLDFGVVESGSNRDSDYDGDDRTQEFSRSINGVDGNSVWNASAGIGPRLAFFDETIVVCPLLGYAVSEQDLNIVDGYQAISEPPSSTPIGPIAGLDSRYQTRWKGPWLGADLMVSIPSTQGTFTRVGILFSGEYHWVDYDAEANWNLRQDYRHPVSFSHAAEGSGYQVGAKLLFESGDRWGMQAGMRVLEMTTDSGKDRIYYANGTTTETRLNEVQWRSFTFEAGISCRF